MFQWDATRIPLRDSSVDVILSDLPFGRRCGNHGINNQLYPRLLVEFYRVIRKGSSCAAGRSAAQRAEREWWERCEGGAVPPAGRMVLITVEWRTMTAAINTANHEKRCNLRLVREPFSLDMGGLCPYVFVLDALEATV